LFSLIKSTRVLSMLSRKPSQPEYYQFYHGVGEVSKSGRVMVVWEVHEYSCLEPNML
jgi:hypothetical protein